MMGALAAAHRGASVLLLERDLEGPSNLRVSGGLFPGAGTRFQREAGVEDSAAAFARDVRAKGAATTNEAIVQVVAQRSADAVHFLADACGIPVHLVTKISAPGHSAHRLHATPAESGRELLSLLRNAISRQPKIKVEQRKVENLDSYKTPILLATGGFAANKALLREFLPEVADALHIGAGPNDGCAIEWGRARGAAVAGMDGYQGQGHVNPGGRTRLGMGLPKLGAVLLNKKGERFVDEAVTGPSELAAVVLAQPGGVALEVFDKRIHDTAMSQGPYREAWEAGAIRVADDLSTFGLPPVEMKFEKPIYAAWVTGALAHTQGGLAVDARARVVRSDGTPIEGLYAAGGAAAGLAGRGGEGYLPGNGLAQSFALGLIAGEEIATLR
jgi:fumarate reductase flavoprotein subunit